MRRFNKLKLFVNSRIPFKKAPISLLSLQRPKWFFSKNRIKRLKFAKLNFVDLTVKKIPFKFIPRLKYHYKNTRLEMKSFHSLFDRGYTFCNKKRLKKKKDQLFYNHTSPLFKIDIFLWYAHIFPSLYAARQSVNYGFVLINNARVRSNYALKSGDIVSIKQSKFAVGQVLKKYAENQTFFPFIEVDYYTKTFVIIKGFDELTFEDMKLLT